ncbi:MAG: fatty acid--CoA ligase [Parvibaculaceae bacterium]
MTHIKEISVLADVPRHYGRTRPDDVALVFDDYAMTYKIFDTRTNQVSNGIFEAGVQPKRRVGFIGKNSDTYFEILYGCAKSNTVMVPINWRLAPPELEYILNDAEIELLFVASDCFDLIKPIKANLTTVRKIVALNGTFEDWENYEDWRDRATSVDHNTPVDRDDIAVQMYTSGTTGRPKGAMLSNFGLLAVFEKTDPGSAGDWNDWSLNDVNLITTPIFHIAGTGWGHYSLYNGATSVILPEFDPERILEAIEKYGVTKIALVPAALQTILQSPRSRETDFSSLKYLCYGASPIQLEVLREALDIFRCSFVQLYGMTEMSGAIAYVPPEDHQIDGNSRMRSAGKPLPGIELCILDQEGQKLGPNQIGEICVIGPAVMKGYWKLPEDTAKTMREDGWLCTGDAGFIDEDGYVFVHDRIKDMIVSGAENVYPAEVEIAIYEHPAVEEVAVIGIPSERWGEEVKAIVVLKEGEDITQEDIIRYTRERIAGYKVPKSVDFINKLPRNPSGKIMKQELRSPFWKDHNRMVN